MKSTFFIATTTILLATTISFGMEPSQSSQQDLECRVRKQAPALAHQQHFEQSATIPTSTPIDSQQGKACVMPKISETTTYRLIENSVTPHTPPNINEPQINAVVARHPIQPAANNTENCDATPKATLVYYQRFENGTLVDEVGNFPNGTLVQGTIVPGKYGNALHVEAREAGAVVSMPAGSIGPAGCIEFWAKIDNGAGLCTGTSFCPQFFSVFADGDNRIGIDFRTNFGHYDCGATFHFWGLAFATTYKG